MPRSINELTLAEHHALARYVEAIAARDPAVRLGIADATAVRTGLLAEFDRCLRVASATQLTRSEAFLTALLAL